MGKYLLTKAKILLDGHDMSLFGFSLDTPDEREQVDVSGFNPAGTREYLPGQRDQTITIGFLQGFGTGEPHRVLQPLYESGSQFPLSVVVDSSAPVGPNNPSFGGTASLFAYNGLAGALNARGEITATFRPATGGGFQWGTA
jgi:hypothetical protein